MTPIAERLIHDLRFDPNTREHFSIAAWDGKGTCSTVGCIAGTAVARALRLNRINIYAYNFHIEGAKALGIPFQRTANHLFNPAELAYDLCASCLPPGRSFDYLPDQARPDLDTIEKMVAWALAAPKTLTMSGKWHRLITPDRAAFALERIVKDEVPYCNWAEAFERVPA